MDALLEPATIEDSLPLPGQVIIYDYSDKSNNNSKHPKSETKTNRIKALQWNIERGYKLDKIIDLLAKEDVRSEDFRVNLKQAGRRERKDVVDGNGGHLDNSDHRPLCYHDFDVMAIQELDISCARSNYRNCASELARALKMKMIFVTEFQELYSLTLRDLRSQGGGVHGNGIMTWWDVEKVDVIAHSPEFHWERDGDRLGEPRKGGRYTLAAFLRHPHHPELKVLLYSAHLEVFCGIFGRLRQFSQILAHSHRHLATHPHQMILGDLNTMAHGMARLFSKYCCDALRWGSLGWSESQWWQRNVFDVLVGDQEILEGRARNPFLAAHHHFKFKQLFMRKRQAAGKVEFERTILKDSELQLRELAELDSKSDTEEPSSKFNCHNSHIFSEEELKHLVNPHFYCPFSGANRTRDIITLAVRGYSGKLDWMLMRGWRVLGKGTDNDVYDRSDHKLLWVEVEVVSGEDCARVAHDEWAATNDKEPPQPPRNSTNHYINTRNNNLIVWGVAGSVGLLFCYIYYHYVR